MSAEHRKDWRSLLYVPGNNEKFIAKAQSRGADAIVLDLEDSVPVNQKENGREMVQSWIGKLASGPSQICVRINGSMRAALTDLEAVVQPGLSAVMIAKCESPEKPETISEILSELELERGLPVGQIGLIALIETPRGLSQAMTMAHSSPRLFALLLGSEDFATACAMSPNTETLALAKQQIVFAARSAGLSPLGLMDTVANLCEDALADMVRRSKQFGFSGSTCVHPKVVDFLNTGFSPSDAEIQDAQNIVDAMAVANARGAGAARLGDRMIDAPLLARAERTLRQAGLETENHSGNIDPKPVS